MNISFPQPTSTSDSDWLKTCRSLGVFSGSEVERREEERHPSGVSAMDEALGGGFPMRAISEVVAPERSCGASLLLHRLLRTARIKNSYVAIVDADDRFAPEMVEEEDDLAYCYWVRCRGVEEALVVGDILSSDENFGLLLIDLCGASASALTRIPGNRWFRLQRAVRKHGLTCVVFTPVPTVSAATVRLRLLNRFCLADITGDVDALAETFSFEWMRTGRSQRLEELRSA